MIKSHNLIFIFVLLISFVSSFFFEIPKDEGNSSLITFLSILIGFVMTAFTSLFSSKFVSSLYHEKDKEDNSLTLKHRLKNYFSLFFEFSILSVLFLLCIPNFSWKIPYIDKFFKITLGKNNFLLAIVVGNTLIFYFIFDYFCKIFIKENNNDK